MHLEKAMGSLKEIYMNTVRVLLLGAAVILLTNQAAKATTITASLLPLSLPPGDSPIFLDLGGAVTSQSTVTGTGYSITFSVAPDEGIVQGTGTPHAVPVAGADGPLSQYFTGGLRSSLTRDIAASGRYLSTGEGTITITFSSPQTSLVLLWGSVDPWNSLSFNNTDGLMVTGRQVQNATPGFLSSGFQGFGGSAFVRVDSSTPFTVVTAHSTIVSFEFAAVTATVESPEPGGVMLFGSGIVVIGACTVLRRRLTVRRNAAK